MAKFLTTTAIAAALEEVIQNARTTIVLVSPYIQIHRRFYERLLEANRRGVKVVLIFGKGKIDESEQTQLANLPLLEVYYYDNLHAKCYFNEQQCIITSMNLYAYSEEHNREMGILLSKIEDTAAFDAAILEAKTIRENANRIWIQQNSSSMKKEQASIPPVKAKNPTKKEDTVTFSTPTKSPISAGIGAFLGSIAQSALSLSKKNGSCIRCGTTLPYDPTRPFCAQCYNSWAQFGNIDYPEKCCHSCGKPYKTSFAKPECKTCFSSNS